MIKTEIFYTCEDTANHIKFIIELPTVPNVGNDIIIPHQINNLDLKVTYVHFTANSGTVTVFCVNAEPRTSFYQLSEEEYNKSYISWYKDMGATNKFHTYEKYLEYIPFIRTMFSK
jgi:hypothetical protein